MEHTTNYHLPQWEAEDFIKRDDFNDAFSAIDAALAEHGAALAEKPYAIGSYTGNGQYGSSHPNTLSFSFTPKFVAVFGASYVCFFAGKLRFSGVDRNAVFVIHVCTRFQEILRCVIIWIISISFSKNKGRNGSALVSPHR